MHRERLLCMMWLILAAIVCVKGKSQRRDDAGDFQHISVFRLCRPYGPECQPYGPERRPDGPAD